MAAGLSDAMASLAVTPSLSRNCAPVVSTVKSTLLSASIFSTCAFFSSSTIRAPEASVLYSVRAIAPRIFAAVHSGDKSAVPSYVLVMYGALSLSTVSVRGVIIAAV